MQFISHAATGFFSCAMYVGVLSGCTLSGAGADLAAEPRRASREANAEQSAVARQRCDECTIEYIGYIKDGEYVRETPVRWARGTTHQYDKTVVFRLTDDTAEKGKFVLANETGQMYTATHGQHGDVRIVAGWFFFWGQFPHIGTDRVVASVGVPIRPPGDAAQASALQNAMPMIFGLARPSAHLVANVQTPGDWYVIADSSDSKTNVPHGSLVELPLFGPMSDPKPVHGSHTQSTIDRAKVWMDEVEHPGASRAP